MLPRTALLYDVATRSDEALLVSLAREGAGFAVGDPSHLPPLAATAKLLSTARLTSCEDVTALATAGVRQFVVRSAEETCRVAIAAPGSSVLVRVVPLASAGDAAQDQGCTVAEAVTVLRQACASGLDIAGVSFEIASLRRSRGRGRRPSVPRRACSAPRPRWACDSARSTSAAACPRSRTARLRWRRTPRPSSAPCTRSSASPAPARSCGSAASSSALPPPPETC